MVDVFYFLLKVHLMKDGTFLAASKCSRTRSFSSVQRKLPTVALDYELI
jgi:hypothetical protein